MEPKSIFKTPKFLSIKIFIVSISAALTLWIWGVISAKDMINQAVNAASGANATATQAQPTNTTTLRKVQLSGTPTPVPAVNATRQTANSKSLPLTNTGSSRP
jgi:hypothetical protein